MRKLLKLIPVPLVGVILAVLFILAPLQEAAAQTYCFPTYSPQGNNWQITQFSVPEISYSINIPNWNQTDNTSEIIAVSAGSEYTFQITTVGWVGVGVACDLNNDGDFDDTDEILAIPTYIADNPANYEYTITIPSDQLDGSYRLRLWNALANSGDGTPAGSPCGTYGWGTYADFTLYVGDCLPPANIQISDIGQNEATVNWATTGLAELWNIEYGISGFELGEGTLITGLDTNIYEITELSTDTQYDVYVQSDCAGDGLSDWFGPISFTTHFISVPIEVIGFSDDVIANGVGSMLESTTNIVDSDSFCFLSQDWKLNEGDPDITVGLPENGIITSSEFPGLTYQMSPFDNPYEGDNSLRLANVDDSGVLELEEPQRYRALYLLTTSGSGSSTVEIVVSFNDGSSQLFMSQIIPDWYQTGSIPVELSGFGRGDANNDIVETPPNNPKLFRLTIDIDAVNINKLITAIGITKVGGSGVFNVFAVSGKVGEETCEVALDFSIDEIDTTTIDISWTEPEDTFNIENYNWIVVMEGQTPFEDDHVAEGIADVGETSTTVSGLEPNTSYDIYFVSVCNLDEMFLSDFTTENFTTENLSVNDMSFSGFSFYPNPAESILYLEAQEPLQEVQIFNLRGQEVFSEENSLRTMYIDLRNLTAGVYIMKVTISGTSKTYKVLVK